MPAFSASSATALPTAAAADLFLVPLRLSATAFWTVDAAGYEVEIVTDAAAPPQPLDWYLVDQSYDLPASAAPLLAARPATSAPMQDGNVTMVSRKARI